MATLQEINELKEKIALSCRILGFRGVTKGSFGHVSARMPGDKVHRYAGETSTTRA